MIRLFNRNKRVLFFPTGWANSVSRWLLGVRSPSGTVKVKNTAHPSGDGSLEIDVDVDAVFGKIAKMLDGKELTAAARRRIKEVLRTTIDGRSIVVKGGKVEVNADWVRQLIESMGREEDASEAVNVTDEVVYVGLHSPSGTSHYYGTKVLVSVENGKVTKWQSQGVYDIFTGDPASA